MIKNKGYTNYITALELRQEEEQGLLHIADEVIIDDFLKWNTDRKFKTIIGNPPYSLGLEFIEKCFELLEDDGEIIMLLRTAFLESKRRYDFWQKHPLNNLYVLSQRPSFTSNGKSDATSYSFFVWKKNNNNQEIKVI